MVRNLWYGGGLDRRVPGSDVKLRIGHGGFGVKCGDLNIYSKDVICALKINIKPIKKSVYRYFFF